MSLVVTGSGLTIWESAQLVKVKLLQFTYLDFICTFYTHAHSGAFKKLRMLLDFNVLERRKISRDSRIIWCMCFWWEGDRHWQMWLHVYMALLYIFHSAGLWHHRWFDPFQKDGRTGSFIGRATWYRKGKSSLFIHQCAVGWDYLQHLFWYIWHSKSFSISFFLLDCSCIGSSPGVGKQGAFLPHGWQWGLLNWD